MINYLQKALNVRRDEFGAASLLFLYLFFIIAAYIMGQSVGKAMYLNAFARYLPHAIIATALVVGIFASVYIRLSHHLRLGLLIIGSLLFFALSFVVFWWLTRLRVTWVYPLIYIWVYLAGAMGPTMGWTLGNCLLTTRQARRVFGFIGAGAILGAPCAGLFVADVIRAGHMRMETVLLVVAAALGLCAFLVWMLVRQASEGGEAALALAVPVSGDVPKNFRQSWSHIRGSRYLLLITGLIAAGCAATTIIGYQFDMIAYARYGADKVSLAVFFGRFNGYLGLAAFVLQMFVTGRLMRSFGIRATLLVLPVVFLAGTFALLLAPILLTACLLKGSHLLLRFSLDKSSTELLYLPVVPPGIKSQIKSFIDGFIWRTADGVAGVLLLVFANKLKFSPGRVGLVNIVFLAAWIVIAYSLRREYLNILRQAIEQRQLDPQRTTAEMLDHTTTEVLAHALERGGEEQVLYGLSLFEAAREPAWHPVLRRLLEHSSPSVRQRAFQLLNDAGDGSIVPQAEKLLSDESLEVRTEAVHYLAVHAGRDPLALLKSELNIPTPNLQGAVVACCARTGYPDMVSAAELILYTMLSASPPEDAASRREAARALGAIPPPSKLHTSLVELLGDFRPEVAQQALLAAGKIRRREFLPSVIEKLQEPNLRGAARAALAQYGELAVGTLHDYLDNDAIPTGLRRQIPHVLARIATPAAAAVLTDSLLQSDPNLRFEILRALNGLQRRDPTLVQPSPEVADLLESELIGYYRSVQILATLDPPALQPPYRHADELLLTRALRERMVHELNRIFRLLALLYPPRDIFSAYAGVTSGRPQLQANALEVLEHLLPADFYRRLAYGLDPEISPKEKLAFAQHLCRTSLLSNAEALRVLLFSKDRWLCACALHTIGELRLVDLAADVQAVPHEHDAVLDETWRWTRFQLAAARTA